MKEKSVLTISRKWNNPRILTTITNDEISLKIDLLDFEEALVQEIGSVAMTFTNKQLRDKIKRAIDNVLAGVKEESAKVVDH